VKFLLILSSFVFLSAGHRPTGLTFENAVPGTSVSSFPNGQFIGRGTVESGGPTGNFLHLAPDPSFSVPTEAMQPLAFASFTGATAYHARGLISSFDVRLPTGGTMLYGAGSVTRVKLAASQWYHFQLRTPYIVKFHSAGGADLDNLTVLQTLMTGQSPRRFGP